jgi:two-component system CheB/CheR fusion protein
VQLVDDLLDVSRIISGKLHVEFEQVDLVATVRAAVEVVSGSAARRRVDVKVGLPESPVMISGDPIRLQQVVLNLLTNAIKFTPGAGRLTGARCRQRATLVVDDTGMESSRRSCTCSMEFAQQTPRARELWQSRPGARHCVPSSGWRTVRADSPGSGRVDLFGHAAAAALAGPAGQSRGEWEACVERRINETACCDVSVLIVDDDGGVRDAVSEC